MRISAWAYNNTQRELTHVREFWSFHLDMSKSVWVKSRMIGEIVGKNVKPIKAIRNQTQL